MRAYIRMSEYSCAILKKDATRAKKLRKDGGCCDA